MSDGHYVIFRNMDACVCRFPRGSPLLATESFIPIFWIWHGVIYRTVPWTPHRTARRPLRENDGAVRHNPARSLGEDDGRDTLPRASLRA